MATMKVALTLVATTSWQRIALKTRVPTLPGLGTKISTALRPAAVGDDFHTGRINWTIQASGAEMLAMLL